MPSLSRSALVLRLDGDRDDRLGELHPLEHDRVLLVAERVAGGVSRRPTAAQMSPALHSSISSRLLACICSRRPMRSRLPRVELQHARAALERARVDAEEGQVAANGSFMILNARAANGASSSALRTLDLVRRVGCMPSTGGMSSGDGRKLTTASSSGCTPLFLKAEPQSTGTSLKPQRALAERGVGSRPR